MARPVTAEFLATDPQHPSGLLQLQQWQTQTNLGVGKGLDGAIVDLGFSRAVFSTSVFEPTQYLPAAQVVRSVGASGVAVNLQRLDLSAMTGAAWTDDVAFAQMATRLEAAGALIQQAQMRGVLLANQMYGQSVFAVPPGTEMSFGAWEALVRRRASDLTAALLRGFPSVEIMVLWAYSEMFREVCLEGRKLPDHPYALYPAFLDGVRDALGRATNGAKLIDGYLPAYPVRSPAHFSTFAALVHGDQAMLARHWQPNIVTHWDDLGLSPGPVQWPSSFTVVCDKAMASRLSIPLPTAFGLMVDYDINDFPGKVAGGIVRESLAPGLLEAAIAAAARASDSYIWLYSEKRSWWLESGEFARVDDATRQSVRAARARLSSDPLGITP